MTGCNVCFTCQCTPLPASVISSILQARKKCSDQTNQPLAHVEEWLQSLHTVAEWAGSPQWSLHPLPPYWHRSTGADKRVYIQIQLMCVVVLEDIRTSLMARDRLLMRDVLSFPWLARNSGSSLRGYTDV